MATINKWISSESGWVNIPGSVFSNAKGANCMFMTSVGAPAATMYGHTLQVSEGVRSADLPAGDVWFKTGSKSLIVASE